jgi:hypothetical protein
MCILTLMSPPHIFIKKKKTILLFLFQLMRVMWNLRTYFMLGWLRILSYMNNNQHDALFIFNLLNYHSTCFGHINSPSSGGRMYICGKWYLLYCTVECQRASFADSQLSSVISTIYHIYTPYLLMMGCWYARNM